MSTPTWKARIIVYLLHNGFVLDMTPPHTARYAKYRQVKGMSGTTSAKRARCVSVTRAP